MTKNLDKNVLIMYSIKNQEYLTTCKYTKSCMYIELNIKIFTYWSCDQIKMESRMTNSPIFT